MFDTTVAFFYEKYIRVRYFKCSSNLDAFFLATERNDLEAVRYFAKFVNVNQKVGDGAVLHIAAICGKIDIARLLVKELGAEINIISCDAPYHLRIF